LIIIAQLPDFSSDVLGGLSGSGSVGTGDGSQFGLNKVHEFFVSLDSGSTNHDIFGSDVFKLESLKNVGTQVINISRVSVKGHTKISKAIGSSEKFVIHVFSVVKLFSQFLRVVIFILSNTCGDYGSGFKRAISNHIENIDNIVRQTAGSEV